MEKEKKEYKIKPFEELTLMDDYMFAAVMSDKKILKPLLEYILDIQILEIEFVEKQKSMKEGYESHGIRLDLYVKDASGQIFNCEVQTTNKRYLPKRMRYYQSVIDIDILAPGVEYWELKRSFVIFITNFDPFKKSRYIYTFENRCVQEPELCFGDETVKVVVTTKGTTGEISDELKESLTYFDQQLVSGDYSRKLDQAVKNVKASKERRHEYMIMEIREMEARAEAIAEGREEGRILGTVETMLDDGKSVNEIISRIMSKYNLNDEEAKTYVDSVLVLV